MTAKTTPTQGDASARGEDVYEPRRIDAKRLQVALKGVSCHTMQTTNLSVFMVRALSFVHKEKTMSLDIAAYKQLTKIDCVFDDQGEPIYPETRQSLGYEFQAYINFGFPGRNGTIQDRAIYSAAERHVFRAGSYSAYNSWRNELAKLAGYPAKPVDRYKTGNVQQRHDQGAWDADSGPFWELIKFSDCEGVIGSEVSTKLAKDFAEYQSAVDALDDEYFRERYNEWRKAFEIASDNGAVEFR